MSSSTIRKMPQNYTLFYTYIPSDYKPTAVHIVSAVTQMLCRWSTLPYQTALVLRLEQMKEWNIRRSLNDFFLQHSEAQESLKGQIEGRPDKAFVLGFVLLGLKIQLC